MNRPKLIMHDSVSLDGSFVGFEGDAVQHYNCVRDYRFDMSIKGSKTLVTGLETYDGFSPEKESDFMKPDKLPGTAYWVVPDSGGITKGWLHIARRSEYCRDVILLVSEKTSHKFIEYLEERHYDYLVCGDEKVDLTKALDWLVDNYSAEKILVDAGPTLNGVLLKQRLLDEISLLVHPVLVGSTSDKLLIHLIGGSTSIELELLKNTPFENGTVLLVYRIVYK
jgi:2,5-diamino-6-(ribosylamino)-4(3H)-pyrimidinone 5'-phosphate reductase